MEAHLRGAVLAVTLFLAGVLALLAPAPLHAQGISTVSDPLSDSLSEGIYAEQTGDPGLLSDVDQGVGFSDPTIHTGILDPLYSWIGTGNMQPYATGRLPVTAPLSNVSSDPATDPELLKRGEGLGGTSVSGWRGGSSQFGSSGAGQHGAAARALAGSGSTLPMHLGIQSTNQSRVAFAGDTNTGGASGQPSGLAPEAADPALADFAASSTPVSTSGPLGLSDPYLPGAAPFASSVYAAPFTKVSSVGSGDTVFPSTFPELGEPAAGAQGSSAASVGLSYLRVRELEHAPAQLDQEPADRLHPDPAGLASGYGSPALTARRSQPITMEQLVRQYRREQIASGYSGTMPSPSELRKIYRRRLEQQERGESGPTPGITNSNTLP